MARPVLGPDPSPSSSPISTPTANLSTVSLGRTVTASLRGRSTDSVRSSYSAISRSSSSASIPFCSDEGVEVVTDAGLRHATGKLNAKRYKTREFASDLLDIIASLKVPTWFAFPEPLSPDGLKVSKVSGSLTNAVFFITYPSIRNLKTLLLRVYGPSSSALISRPHELRTLHVLSSKYRIGPRVYGTFDNGRIEEYFDSAALTAAEMRNLTISAWIGARMAELHCVDIELIEETAPSARGENVGWDIAARKNFREWLRPAREVLRLSSVSREYRVELDLDRLVTEWEGYMAWLDRWEKTHGASKRVFAHNDTQYGNLLRLKKIKGGVPEHRQIIVVDFEYASPNAAAFDIANHFHEWTANYHSSTPHILDPKRYPNEQERQNFYRAYLKHSRPPYTTASVPDDDAIQGTGGGDVPLNLASESRKLEAQVRAWSPACHAMWVVWGLIQAREDLELAVQARARGLQPDRPDFDYLGYARCRAERFREEIQILGLQLKGTAVSCGSCIERSD